MTSRSRARVAPSIADPSSPTPSSSAGSSSETGMASDLRMPSTSTNHRRTKRTPRSSTVRRTYASRGPISWSRTVGPGLRRRIRPTVETRFARMSKPRAAFIGWKHSRRARETAGPHDRAVAAPHLTLCPYCGTGCGLEVDVRDGRVAAVRGDARHPVNRGRTCRKPTELAAAVHARDRATTPLLRRDGRLVPQSWDETLGEVAGRLRAIIAEHGPDAVAFYISGQLLTEDYYAFNKLAKGFLGTNNVDANSRLCMSSAVAGYTGAFGADGPPAAYADLARADCLLLLGTNTAACHPIVWGRIRDRHTTGFDDALTVAADWTPERAADVCGVPAADIVRAAELFASAGAAMTLWSMGANQSTVGTLKNRALINLCLATGNLGRRGCGPLSLTGQPNAMGGREVGGLAHLLPGYRRVDDAGDRAAMAAHWGVPVERMSPRVGLTATELVDALLDGRVRALLVAATNPVVSLPDGARVRAALERAELLVVQDCHHPTETSALAHAVLPAAAWPEKEGTMTSSERRVGGRRQVLGPSRAGPSR